MPFLVYWLAPFCVPSSSFSLTGTGGTGGIGGRVIDVPAAFWAASFKTGSIRRGEGEEKEEEDARKKQRRENDIVTMHRLYPSV